MRVELLEGFCVFLPLNFSINISLSILHALQYLHICVWTATNIWRFLPLVLPPFAPVQIAAYAMHPGLQTWPLHASFLRSSSENEFFTTGKKQDTEFETNHNDACFRRQHSQHSAAV